MRTKVWPALVVAASLAAAGMALAQVQPAVPAALQPATAEKPAEKPAAKPDEKDNGFRGAELLQDFELERLFHKSRELLQGTPVQRRDAIGMLQEVIDKGHESLTSDDGITYHSIRRSAELALLAGGKEVLETYRSEADAQLRALLGPKLENRDEALLRKAVDRFFLSSDGDRAAFALGCLYLDKMQFAQARRLFARILEESPDPKTPKADVLLRMALACGRSGDAEGAKATLEKLRALAPNAIRPAAIDAVEKAMAASSQTPQERLATLAELLASLKTGNFAGGDYAGLCVPQWERELPLKREYFSVTGGHSSRIGESSDFNFLKNRFFGRWEQGGFFPNAMVRFQNDLALVRASCGLVCVNAQTGDLVWESRAEIAPADRSRRVFYSSGNIDVQMDPETGHMARVVDGAVYDVQSPDPRIQPGEFVVGVQMAIVVNGRTVTPSNRPGATGDQLVAFDLPTGKRRWMRGRTANAEDPLTAADFVVPPVRAADRLLFPMAKKGELHLVALSPVDGQFLWKTFLCGWPTAQQHAPAPQVSMVDLAVRGNDVFIATGQGAVLAVDAADGAVRWACRYERSWNESARQMMAFNAYGVKPQGARQNSVFVDADRVVVVPVDASTVLTIDALSGKPLGKTAIPDNLCAAGFADGKAFLHGANIAICVDYRSSERVWEFPFPSDAPCCGRAWLAADAILAPSGRSIVCLDLKKGSRLAALRVAVENDPPVGNVFAHGNRIFVAGLDRLMALTTADARLAELDQLAAKAPEDVSAIDREINELKTSKTDPTDPFGDASHRLEELADKKRQILSRPATALLERSKLMALWNRTDDALADARAALAKSVDEKQGQTVRRELVKNLIRSAEKHPDRAASLLAEAGDLAIEPGQKIDVALRLAAARERAGELAKSLDAILNLTDSKSDTLEIETPDGHSRWKVASNVLAAGSVRAMFDRQGEKIRPVLARRAEEALAEAKKQPDWNRFRAVFRLYPATEAGIEAGLKAAELAAEKEPFEIGELILREMARSADAPTAAAGLAALAELHQSKGWNWHARREWQRLADNYADVPLAMRKPGEEAQTFAKARLADPKLGDVLNPKGTPELPWRVIWQEKIPSHQTMLRLLSHRHWLQTSQFLEENLLTLRYDNQQRLVCRRLDNGKIVYETPIAMGQVLDDAQSNRDGHVAFAVNANRNGKLCDQAIGLTSGKILWTREKSNPNAVQVFSSSVSYNSGQTVGIPRRLCGAWIVQNGPQSAAGIDLATGQIAWERSFARATIVWIVEDERHVVLGLDNGDAMVCDPFSGVVINTFRPDFGTEITSNPAMLRSAGQFVQPNSRGMFVRRPNSPDGIIQLLDLPSGKVRWSLSAGTAFQGPFFLADRSLAVLANEECRVVDPETGETRWTWRDAKNAAAGVRGRFSGSLLASDSIGRRLYVQLLGGASGPGLACLDLDTGKELWRNVQEGGTPMGSLYNAIAAEALVRSCTLAPRVQTTVKTENNRSRREISVQFFSKADGRNLSENPLPFSFSEQDMQTFQQCMVRNGFLVFQFGNSTVVVGTK